MTNLVTPEQAATMVCPFKKPSQYVTATAVPSSIPSGMPYYLSSGSVTTTSSVTTMPDPTGANCIGQRCMMWRWRAGHGVDGRYSGLDERVVGQCGLAGE